MDSRQVDVVEENEGSGFKGLEDRENVEGRPGVRVICVEKEEADRLRSVSVGHVNCGGRGR